ncbi:unnamed protein product [Protopolystoma xenopodis]|uniref:Uncharacterized protein n=1 Tax=Protopolystoma xenopodis TaxID=117903 RepID=A0A3S5AE53_9PLAT|nr:unnamed protein product [Protopolystoma xenopodis]
MHRLEEETDGRTEPDLTQFGLENSPQSVVGRLKSKPECRIMSQQLETSYQALLDLLKQHEAKLEHQEKLAHLLETAEIFYDHQHKEVTKVTNVSIINL